MNFLKKAARSISFQDVWGSDSPSSGWRSISNPATPERALRLTAFWASVRLIADGIASLPVERYRVQGGEMVFSGTPKLFENPGEYGTVFDWKFRLMTSLLLRGNAYGLPTSWDHLGYPTGIEWIPPDFVFVQQQPMGGRPRIFVAGEDMTGGVIHIPAFVLPGRAEGLSPVMFFKTLIEAGLSAEEFGASFFRDGAHPSGVLESAQPLDKTTATAIKERFMEAMGKKREPAVLGKGLVWKPIQIAPEESQFLETQRFTANQVAAIFGILSPEMVGGVASSSMTYQTIEQRSIDLGTWTLRPWTVRLEEAFNVQTPKPERIRFDLDAIVRTDLLTRFKAHQIALLAGFKNRDEVRKVENDPPLPEGEGKKFNWPPGPHPAESTSETALPAPDGAPSGGTP